MDKSFHRTVPHRSHDSTSPPRRRSSDARDAALLPLTTRWYSDLPDEARPELLIERFPVIANKLALTWPEASGARKLLDELLIDRRGGRSGFPSRVVSELLGLHGLLGKTAPDTAPQDIWS